MRREAPGARRACHMRRNRREAGFDRYGEDRSLYPLQERLALRGSAFGRFSLPPDLAHKRSQGRRYTRGQDG
jgi:hypothetical protein